MKIIRNHAAQVLAPLVLGLAAMLASAAGVPDFSGAWQINPAKSENLGMMAAVKLEARFGRWMTTLATTPATGSAA